MKAKLPIVLALLSLAVLLIQSPVAAGSSTTYQFATSGNGTLLATTQCTFFVGGPSTSCTATGVLSGAAGPNPIVGNYTTIYSITAQKGYVGAAPGEICAPFTAKTTYVTTLGLLYLTESGDVCQTPPTDTEAGLLIWTGDYHIQNGTVAFSGASGNGLFIANTQAAVATGTDLEVWRGTIKY